MANVLFKRIEDSSQLDNYPVVDGSLWITGDGKTFIDYNNERIAIGGTPDTQMSSTSTNSVQNNVIKEYVDNVGDRVSVFEYNLITNGDPVKTGRQIDSKDEYVKRISLPSLPAQNETKTWATGIDMTNIVITDIKIIVKTGSYNWFTLPNNDTANCRAQLNDDGKISITCFQSNLNGTNGYAEIRYYHTN